jgi:hypothetical protein
VKPDPVISPGLWKAIGILFVAALLGGGAYSLAGGGIDLPDIDLPETTTATNLTDTSLESTTIGEPTEVEPTEPVAPAPADPFSSASLSAAVAKVGAEVGSAAKLQRLLINDAQTQFIVQKGQDVGAYGVLVDTGELTQQNATITVNGNATLDDFAFKLSSVETGAVDRMLAKARKLSKAPDFAPTTLNLERDLSNGLRPPEWTINATGGSRYLQFKSNAAGTKVKNTGGSGSEIPQAAIDAQKLSACIRGANGDFDAIQRCFDLY